MHLQVLLCKFVECLEIYSVWIRCLCMIHLCCVSVKLKTGVASKHVILINIFYLWAVILLIQSCSRNFVTFPQSLWQIRYCLLFHCWHKSTWNMKLVWGTLYHVSLYEADGMLLERAYVCYWQLLSKVTSLCCLCKHFMHWRIMPSAVLKTNKKII